MNGGDLQMSFFDSGHFYVLIAASCWWRMKGRFLGLY